MSDQRHAPHTIEDVHNDPELRAVFDWFTSKPIDRLFTTAVTDAVDYVLDGARTYRFDLDSPDVDSDERASVGTKLQYRLLDVLGLRKQPPLDTIIDGIPVELKGTVRRNWMIPREGQCQICLLIQVDTKNDAHRAFLMRTHRQWLNAPNQDLKRTIRADALANFAVPILNWTPLPTNPLKLLPIPERDYVLDFRVGQLKRLTALFGYLPNTVIPRNTILTVGANRKDVLRRAREAKGPVFDQHGLWVLCGTWTEEYEEARRRGYDLSDEAWIAVTP